MIRRVGLALLILAATAAPASAYQHLSENEGPPSHWLHLPIPLTIDNGPTDISSEVADATATWNGVGTAKDPWGTLTKAVDGSGNPVDFNSTQLPDRLGQPHRRRQAGGDLRRVRQRAARARPRPRVRQRLRPERHDRRRGPLGDRRHVPDHQRVAHATSTAARPRCTSSGTRSASRTRPSASPSARTARWTPSSRARCRRCTRSRSPAPTAARSRPTTSRRCPSCTRRRRSRRPPARSPAPSPAAAPATRCSAPTCARSTSPTRRSSSRA